MSEIFTTIVGVLLVGAFFMGLLWLNGMLFGCGYRKGGAAPRKSEPRTSRNDL